MTTPPDNPYPPPPGGGGQYPPPGQPPTPPPPPGGQPSYPGSQPTTPLPPVSPGSPYGAPSNPYAAPPVPGGPGGPPYPPPGGGGGAGGGSNRGPLIAVIAVLVVIALAVGGYFLFKGDDKKKTPVANGSTTPVTSAPGSFPPDTSAVVTESSSGSGGTASWSDFTEWSELVGSSDGTVTVPDVGDFQCELKSTSSGDPIDYVDCTHDASDGEIEILVGRFASADGVQSQVQDAIDKGAKHVQWTSNGTPYGTKFTEKDDDGTLTIGTTFCSIPTYLLIIATQESSSSPALTSDALNDVWKAAPFPKSATETAC